MVHLASIKHDGLVDQPLVKGLEKLDIAAGSDEDSFATTVYGSRFAAEDMPKHEMPEKEMPKEVAYRMIKDDLSLDGNPMLNLASFVTTFMEKEVEDLMTESFSKNFIDYEEYPQSADIQNRCVSMIGRLFNAPTASETDAPVGTSTVGSSEAIMLGVLAMKKRWQNARKAAGKPWDKPNIVMSSAVQVCWEKAARYFEVEEKYVYCTQDRYVIDPEETVNLVDENTIGICVILGTTYTGEYEDAKKVNDLLIERNIDTVIHIDAASGGFVAPFVVPELEWDFRLEKVVSINTSGHKYGLVYPGVGWVIWRAPEYLPKELVFNINYLGADQASFTLNFSKGASQVIGQYYQLIRLGKRGYRSIMSNLTRTADYLSDSLSQLGFIIMSQKNGQGLPLVAFRLDPKAGKHYDEFALAHQLRGRSWVVPAYTMAPNTKDLKMLRVVVREDFSKSRCDQLLADIKLCIGVLDDMDKNEVVRSEKYIKEHQSHSGRSGHNHEAYRKEKHSLQGKTGKTHAIC
ncbi:uncharacterized protein L3040_004228 [Drepanopeziza brunnea f. sp. 'multigermtubi']|uniref:uncharacterized protein n=1 Tax=Drepanopeziza brunnea f. sp. 'multigermtubi' TaxID=698441 RepID=UPI00238775D2|nr:hypothetical protein L3040_004228 [Drepanopeziza brunnea f. sp. 'multigermtubi']